MAGPAPDENVLLVAEEECQKIARGVRAVLAASRAIDTLDRERHPEAFGDAPWLAVFDDQDLAAFVDEMGGAILGVLGSIAGPLDRLYTLGQGWRTTATVLADPVSREVLLGPHNANDFIEVQRPV
ncbi:MAG: hypothetical protein ACRDZR_02470 [Acidimicrobiales bacterium]